MLRSFRRTRTALVLLVVLACQCQLSFGWTLPQRHSRTTTTTTPSVSEVPHLSLSTLRQQQRQRRQQRQQWYSATTSLHANDSDESSSLVSSTTQSSSSSSSSSTTPLSSKQPAFTSLTPPPLLLLKNPRPRPCYYEQDGQYRLLRRQLQDLGIGQRLKGTVVSDQVLQGKTGPKVFLEVGVGRCRVHSHTGKTTWSIVYGMLRLGGPNMKDSIGRKKAAKLRSKTLQQAVAVFVTRLDPASSRLEVSLEQPPEEEEDTDTVKNKQSVASLRPGQEMRGTIERVEDYGCLVRLDNVNRHGLLQIQSVADLYATFIDKKLGLIEAGLERGATVKVQVKSVQGKRLLLDFTEQTKQQAAEELLAKQQPQPNPKLEHEGETPEDVAVASTLTTTAPALSTEEEEAWAAYAAQDFQEEDEDDEEDDNDDDDDYDEFDEDRDIEDSLGLGTY